MSSTVPVPRRCRLSVRRLAIVGALIVAASCSTSVGTQPAEASLGGPTTAKVELRALKFRPDKLTVKVGTRVDWVWRENVAHNVIFKDKSMNSKVLNKGTYSYTFKKTGTFKYDCTLHPGMKGEIKVVK